MGFYASEREGTVWREYTFCRGGGSTSVLPTGLCVCTHVVVRLYYHPGLDVERAGQWYACTTRARCHAAWGTVVRLYYHERMNDFHAVQLYYRWAMGRGQGGREKR